MPVHCQEFQFAFLCFVSCSNGGGGFSCAERVFHWTYLWQRVFCCVRKAPKRASGGFSHTSNLDSLGLSGCEPHSGIPTPYLRLAQWEHILVCFVTRLLPYWLPRPTSSCCAKGGTFCDGTREHYVFISLTFTLAGWYINANLICTFLRVWSFAQCAMHSDCCDALLREQWRLTLPARVYWGVVDTFFTTPCSEMFVMCPLDEGFW